MELYYLIYTSVPARPMNDADLDDLLSVAREANSRFEVTGMLICLPDSFTQLIEGPKSHIDQLYQNIQQDKRHFKVTTLREGQIHQRFFPDWAMAFRRKDNPAGPEQALDFFDEKVLLLFDIMER